MCVYVCVCVCTCVCVVVGDATAGVSGSIDRATLLQQTLSWVSQPATPNVVACPRPHFSSRSSQKSHQRSAMACHHKVVACICALSLCRWVSDLFSLFLHIFLFSFSRPPTAGSVSGYAARPCAHAPCAGCHKSASSASSVSSPLPALQMRHDAEWRGSRLQRGSHV